MKMKYLYALSIVLLVGYFAIPRFMRVTEQAQAMDRVQVFPDSIRFIGVSSTSGDDTLLLRLPVHYYLTDSTAALAKISDSLAVWLANHPFRIAVADRYYNRDMYRVNDSATIVVTEYYIAVKKK